MNKYKIDKLISNTSNSNIYWGKNIGNGENVIIKKFKKKFNDWDECMNINEISILCKFNNDHIIKIKEVVKKNLELNIIYEYGGINLTNFFLDIKNNIKDLDDIDIRNIFYQIVIGLDYIHKMGYIHQNFTSENILINNKKVKIIGFSNCCKTNSKTQNFKCNIWFRSPEMLLGMSTPSQKNDIFALGIIFLMFFKLKIPFQGCDIKSQLNYYCEVLGKSKLLNWKEGKKLLLSKGINIEGPSNFDISSLIPNLNHNGEILASQILNMNRKERPTTDKILNFYFFMEIHETKTKKEKVKKIMKDDYYKLISTYGQKGMGYLEFQYENNMNQNEKNEKNNMNFLSLKSRQIIEKTNNLDKENELLKFKFMNKYTK